MASLLEAQRRFAAALQPSRATEAADATSLDVRPAANLEVYQNNTQHQFHQALALSFPVLRRRVGEDYFRQLGRLYRQRHPSRSGDLHWVGQHFASFLDAHLREGEYAWLADLARLEWARELAAVAPLVHSLGVECLATVPADRLPDLVFRLQPSLQRVRSPFPVFSVWRANQQQIAPPVDQSLGSEQGLIFQRIDEVSVVAVDAALFSFLCALAAGRTLGQAMTEAELDEPGLLEALRFSFAQGLLCGVSLQDSSNR